MGLKLPNTLNPSSNSAQKKLHKKQKVPSLLKKILLLSRQPPPPPQDGRYVHMYILFKKRHQVSVESTGDRGFVDGGSVINMIVSQRGTAAPSL